MQPNEPPNPPARSSLFTLQPLSLAVQTTMATLRGYNGKTLRSDFLAGLTVAVVAVPQAMAYAIIAEVPPVYGLYTLIFQCLIGSFFNSHPKMNLGPVNSQSLVVASVATRLISPGDTTAYITLVVTLTLLKGVVQMCMAVLRLGQLTRYVSRSAIVGFTAGAGLLIAAKQIGPFLGFETHRAADDWPGLVGVGQQLIRNMGSVSGLSVMLGIIALAVMIGSRLISRLMPGPLLAVGVTALIVLEMGWTHADFGMIGQVPLTPDDWPLPEPRVDWLERLVPAALALALLGMLETYAIGRSLGDQDGHRIRADQDMFNQGLTHAITSFVGCIPGSVSLSRSALNESAGAKTLVSNFFIAGFVAIALIALGPLAEYIPNAAIAAILFVIAWRLIDWSYIRRVSKTSRAEIAVLLATFVATLVVPLEYAVLVGVALNIALYLRLASELHLREMVPTAAGPFMEQRLNATSGERAVTLLQLEGRLFFALADELEDQLRSLERSPVRVVILRLRRVHSIDATVMSVLERFTQRMQRQGKHVVLCGLTSDLFENLNSFGLVDQIGPDNVITTSFGVFEATQKALERAKELTGVSIDADALQ